MDMTMPRLRRAAQHLPLSAVPVLIALFAANLALQPRSPSLESSPPADVMSADGFELSTVPDARSLGRSDAERNRTPDHLPHVFVLAAVALGTTGRGWTLRCLEPRRPPRAGFVAPHAARAPPVRA